MEELKTTESLDREIENDALRKAAQIQKKADESIEKTKKEWDARLKASLTKEEERFKAMLAARKMEVDARLALDKRRLEWERAENALNNAENEFFASLERSEIKKIIENAFESRILKAFDGDFSTIDIKNTKIFCDFLSIEEARSIAEHSFVYFDISGLEIIDYSGGKKRRPDEAALILEAEELRVSASLKAEFENLLLEKRAELAASLLGRDYDG